jgi:hypothetical protein
MSLRAPQDLRGCNLRIVYWKIHYRTYLKNFEIATSPFGTPRNDFKNLFSKIIYMSNLSSERYLDQPIKKNIWKFY